MNEALKTAEQEADRLTVEMYKLAECNVCLDLDIPEQNAQHFANLMRMAEIEYLMTALLHDVLEADKARRREKFRIVK